MGTSFKSPAVAYDLQMQKLTEKIMKTQGESQVKTEIWGSKTNKIKWTKLVSENGVYINLPNWDFSRKMMINQWHWVFPLNFQVPSPSEVWSCLIWVLWKIILPSENSSVCKLENHQSSPCFIGISHGSLCLGPPFPYFPSNCQAAHNHWYVVQVDRILSWAINI